MIEVGEVVSATRIPWRVAEKLRGVPEVCSLVQRINGGRWDGSNVVPAWLAPLGVFYTNVLPNAEDWPIDWHTFWLRVGNEPDYGPMVAAVIGVLLLEAAEYDAILDAILPVIPFKFNPRDRPETEDDDSPFSRRCARVVFR